MTMRVASFFMLMAFSIMVTATAHAEQTIIKGGTWPVQLVHGDHFEIQSLELEKDETFYYTKTDGSEGFSHTTNIKNADELVLLIKAQGNLAAMPKMMEYQGQMNKYDREIKKQEGNLKTELAQMKQESESLERRKHTAPALIIRTDCQNKWKTDYQMVEHCIKTQTEALEHLSQYSGAILETCTYKWDHDYQMIEHCTKEQTAAKKRIGY